LDTAPIQRDSLGVQIVENRTSRDALPNWTLSDTPAYEIGGGDGEPYLYLIRGIVKGRQSKRWAVLGEGESGILVFDSVGNYVSQFGRYGEGPGELAGRYGIHACGRDTVAVAEGRRVSLFDFNGSFIDSTPLSLHGAVTEMQGISDDCQSLFLVQSRLPSVPSQGQVGTLLASAWWYSLGQQDSSDTIRFERSQVLGKQTEYQDIVVLPWGRSAVWAVSDDMVFLGEGATFEIRGFDTDGRLTRITRWATEPTLIPGEAKDKYNAVRARRSAESRTWSDILPELGFAPVPEVFPAFVDFIVDDSGAIWVQEYPTWAAGLWGLIRTGSSGDPPSRWIGFDPMGRIQATLSVPADYRLMWVGGDEAVALWTDSLDVEHLTVHSIERDQ
jgi:hypothetical protein